MERLSLSELFGDMVIFRDLNAMDLRVPRYGEIWRHIGMPGPIPPRKLDMAYARALAWLLARAQEKLGDDRPVLGEIIYLGDTLLNDGGAFQNLRTLTGWSGWCFIGSEKDQEPQLTAQDGLYQSNHWGALAEFFRRARAAGASIDSRTVAIVDIDKTALGARGRNDKPIDHARIAAIESMLHDAVGASFKAAEFRQAYSVINLPRYHSFTADNQDNVAYVCLMLSAGVIGMDDLLAKIQNQQFSDFRQLMAFVDAGRETLAPEVRRLHDDVYARTLAGELTPFKEFRCREYQQTVDRMGQLPEDAPLNQRLTEEICITREVFEACQWLKDRGCLMVALSDKPDEATVPSPGLAAQGYLPLHRTPTHMVGQGLDMMHY